MRVVDKGTLDDVNLAIDSLTLMKAGDPYTNMNGDECTDTIELLANVAIVEDTSNKASNEPQLQMNFSPNKKRPPDFVRLDNMQH